MTSHWLFFSNAVIDFVLCSKPAVQSVLPGVLGLNGGNAAAVVEGLEALFSAAAVWVKRRRADG